MNRRPRARAPKATAADAATSAAPVTASDAGLEASRLDLLARARIFPVRHHSPRSSAALEAFLDAVAPRLVLVEGPLDATPLIDVLVDAETRPPVAILGYRTDGTTGSSLWPFAAYSPEYVALRWARRRGVPAAFIDIPTGRALAAHLHDAHEGETGEGEPHEAPQGEADEGGEGYAPEASLDVSEACARARGHRSFEEFWEASFEAPAHDPASFREAILAYADLVRASQRSLLHRARDAFMARRVLERVASGTAPEEIAVVLGAAHAAAFVARDIDFALEARLPAEVACASTLIPFSFPRLAAQLGYGAGNRAPQYYQRAHDAGASFRRATLEVLVEVTEHLRLEGFAASLADTIEAYRLAVALASHRQKAEPGLDELREAAVATLCRGDASRIDALLFPSVVGRHVGHVAERIGKSSLQAEFAREVKARRLPTDDEPRSFQLKLNEPVQVATSIFLHRLRLAGVPYASYIGKQVGKQGGRAGKSPQEQAGEIDALTRVNEAWEAWWTPATDVALVEKVVLGDTLEQVATSVLEERLRGARGAGEAAFVLLEAVVTDAAQTVSSAVEACERLASSDEDLPSLARAASVLSGLVSYGSSRALAAHGSSVIPALCERTFARAVLRVRGACAGDDDASQEPKEALRSLHAVALAQPRVDRAAWFAAARDLASAYDVNPSASGLAAGLLYLSQVLDDEAVTRLVGLRLSDASEPASAASFLGGFLEVNALALVKSRAVVAALDAFLTGIAPERFRDTLPVLRRAFSALGPTERRYLLEHVLGLRRIGDKAREAEAVLLARDKEKLATMNASLQAAMDDLDDLL